MIQEKKENSRSHVRAKVRKSRGEQCHRLQGTRAPVDLVHRVFAVSSPQLTSLVKSRSYSESLKGPVASVWLKPKTAKGCLVFFWPPFRGCKKKPRSGERVR